LKKKALWGCACQCFKTRN